MILNVIETGAGQPIVLLHGLFGSARNFGSLARRLGRNWHVLALDLRNHGSSPHAPGMDYDTLAADVLETLAARRALPCALLGHSMGGKTAMRAALAEPASVTRLLVADIAPVPYAHGFQGIAQAMAALPAAAARSRATADAALADAVPDPILRGFLLQSLATGGRAVWRIGLAEIAAALPDLLDWKPPRAGARYDGPTLFVAGARSDYLRAAHRPAIRALFPAARFVALKNAGHWLHADAPDAFAEVVATFVGG